MGSKYGLGGALIGGVAGFVGGYLGGGVGYNAYRSGAQSLTSGIAEPKALISPVEPYVPTLDDLEPQQPINLGPMP